MKTVLLPPILRHFVLTLIFVITRLKLFYLLNASPLIKSGKKRMYRLINAYFRGYSEFPISNRHKKYLRVILIHENLVKNSFYKDCALLRKMLFDNDSKICHSLEL